jgi:hypothetical protein
MRKYIALKDEFGSDDGGVASFTFGVQALKKGKVYKETEQHLGYLIDDNGCWRRIDGDGFRELF